MYNFELLIANNNDWSDNITDDNNDNTMNKLDRFDI